MTTYEVANIEKTALNKIGWRYLIIDEAHRCVTAMMCLRYRARSRFRCLGRSLWHQCRLCKAQVFVIPVGTLVNVVCSVLSLHGVLCVHSIRREYRAQVQRV